MSRVRKTLEAMKSTVVDETILAEIRGIIVHARQRTIQAVNAELTLLYWQVGQILYQYVVRGKRAPYGKRVLDDLASRLTIEFGAGWSSKQLSHCLRIAETFSEEPILSASRRELSWTHFKILIYLDDPLEREFYAELCKAEKWSSRQLQERVNSRLFQRTAISKKPEQTIRIDLAKLREKGEMTADLAFRDPYILDFLGLSDAWSEHDLESAILAEIQRFILEMGTDFAFLSRQKRFQVDLRDYRIDLLFYHRRLRCLVAIDLKIGEFEAAHKGQMELYLRYLEAHEMREGENPPVGLILCTGKTSEHVELLQLGKSNIRVAEYITELPARELLEARLHQAIVAARHRLFAENDRKSPQPRSARADK